MRQFNRKYELTIRSSVGPAVIVRDLRITFSIDKSIQSNTKKPNSTVITIFNLSQTSRNRLSEIDDIVILKAGYDNDLPLQTIFTGNITDITHLKAFPNVETQITVSDGYKNLRDGFTTISLGKGKTFKDLISSITKDFNLSTLKIASSDLPDIVFSKGFQFTGPTKNLLDDLTKSASLDWSIQNGALKIENKNNPTLGKTVLLTKSTGMVGVPRRITFIEDASTKDEQKKGWELDCLLQPTVEPGDLVKVQSEEIKEATFFKVRELKHMGDSHGRDWSTLLRTEIL